MKVKPEEDVCGWIKTERGLKLYNSVWLEKLKVEYGEEIYFESINEQGRITLFLRNEPTGVNIAVGGACADKVSVTNVYKAIISGNEAGYIFNLNFK